MNIETPSSADFAELLQVWEDSVRATHDFISEADIAFFKPLILDKALPAVTLRCIRDEAKAIVGFLGVADDKIEMLFVHSRARGQGVGSALLKHAIEDLGANLVDVNEQNPQAVGFYRHQGFKQISRSALDAMGKPFPILHLALDTSAKG